MLPDGECLKMAFNAMQTFRAKCAHGYVTPIWPPKSRDIPDKIM